MYCIVEEGRSYLVAQKVPMAWDGKELRCELRSSAGMSTSKSGYIHVLGMSKFWNGKLIFHKKFRKQRNYCRLCPWSYWASIWRGRTFASNIIFCTLRSQKTSKTNNKNCIRRKTNFSWKSFYCFRKVRWKTWSSPDNSNTSKLVWRCSTIFHCVISTESVFKCELWNLKRNILK